MLNQKKSKKMANSKSDMKAGFGSLGSWTPPVSGVPVAYQRQRALAGDPFDQGSHDRYIAQRDMQMKYDAARMQGMLPPNLNLVQQRQFMLNGGQAPGSLQEKPSYILDRWNAIQNGRHGP